MRLVVFSHKPCWRSAKSLSGYATDGGFPFQMRALSELFDETTLVVPCSEPVSQTGEVVLEGHRLVVAPVTSPFGRGLMRKLLFGFWLLRNSGVIVRELWKADAVHAPIPGDVGTIGMLLAFALRKPLFVRHCGNWFKPVTKAERFWKWFMEMFAGGKQVMLATGGASQAPSARNPNVRWIFSTTLTKNELRACGQSRASKLPAPRMIIVCRQDVQKGTGVVIESLPLVLNAFPNAHLDVVGDGPALRDFRMKAEALGVDNHVTFHGKVDHETVITLLNQASLFCYPTSASEGFPKVVLEALACGLPVVSTRVSVLPLLLSAGGGELLDVSTPTKLAEAVVRILSDSDYYRALSEAALATAEQYSLEAWRDAIGAELQSAWGTLARHNWKHLASMADSHKMRICFITGTLGRGGAERQLVYMLRALKNAGVQTQVLCLTKGEPVEEEINGMGIRVKWVGKSRWRPIRLIRILRELLAERPDLVQSSHFYTNLYAAVAGTLLRIKSIGAIRNDLTSEIQSHGKIGWAQLHLPTHLIANSQLARSRGIATGINPERIDMIANVVAPDDRPRATKSKEKDAIRILFAARLTQQKRPDRFLHTLRNINSARPDLKFTATIAGDGPLRSELHGLASQLGLTERQVEFLGELKDVRPCYHKSDFLMLTSDWEGTPNVLLEAMACGLPVVATKVGGVPEIVDSNRGLIVEAGDDDGLTAATIRMIENSKLRSVLGNRGLEYVSRHHSLAALEDRLTKVYTKLLS